MDLTQKRCIPCEGGFPALTREQASDLMDQVVGWTLNEEATALSRSYKFKDFKEALAFVNQVGELAEEDNHHPNISFTWGKVDLSLTTHSVKGLSENDFILAAKINMLPL
jgi:4a-hydroxytetrahydrobiopterin dehydratase